MRAVTVSAGTDEPVRVQDVPEPDAAEEQVFIEVQSVGLCSTDSVVVSGDDGRPPPSEDHLVLGQESLGRVPEKAPEGSGLFRGDLVVAFGALSGDWVHSSTAFLQTLNADRRHYLQGAVALAAVDRDWLSGPLTRTGAVEDFAEALEPQPDDIKTTLALG